ncbi:MAG TPA: restriction endonuclease [Mycobacteriales bacterium]|nr:restriction endonuclease [Mycobacteriales bacterium]
MTSTVEQGRRLESRMATFFATHGYQTRCNQVVEGRTGGRHEIDVLAEKSDALTTYRVAIECKAWASRVEKDVVAKLKYVLDDTGMHKGIVVSLAGCTSGAQRAAAELGIELWGPDELRRHLGDAAVGELSIPAAVASQSVTWGVPPTAPMDAAERTIRAAGKGRLQLRTLEELVHLTQVWLPVYCLRLTVAQPEARLLKTRLRATTVDNLYEALGGSYLGRLNQPGWTQVNVDHRTMLRPSTKDTKVHAALRKAVEGFVRVSAPAARERHATTLAALGIPTPCESVSIDHTSLAHLPYYVGVLASGGRERVAAVTAWTGELSPRASEVLTAHISQLRSHVAAT